MEYQSLGRTGLKVSMSSLARCGVYSREAEHALM